MIEPGYKSTRRLAALFLLASFAAMAVGVVSFILRGGFGTGPAFERGALMASVVLTIIGVRLLEAPLVDANAGSLAHIGVTAYLIAGPVLLVAEGIALGQGEPSVYSLIVTYVFLALLAQAALGGALIRSRLVPSFVGWLTLAWNVGFMVFLPIVTPQDVYYPLIHGLMPLVIAISLLLPGRPAHPRASADAPVSGAAEQSAPPGATGR